MLCKKDIEERRLKNIAEYWIKVEEKIDKWLMDNWLEKTGCSFYLTTVFPRGLTKIEEDTLIQEVVGRYSEFGWKIDVQSKDDNKFFVFK